jgi:hypothetical protein
MMKQLTSTPDRFVKLEADTLSQFYQRVKGLANLPFEIRTFPSLAESDKPRSKPTRRTYWAVPSYRMDPYRLKV